MKSSRLIAALAACALLATPLLHAQPKGPAASPAQTVTQVVGTTDVVVSYSRPGVKGREIYGGLVPFDKVWRTGANAATKITLAGDATIGGVEVPAGEYGLFTIPGENEWTVILSHDSGIWGAYDYDPANDFARFTVKPTRLKDAVETFTIGFSSFDEYEAVMHLDWAHTRVAFPISTK